MKSIHRKIMEVQARAFDKAAKQAQVPTVPDFTRDECRRMNKKLGQPLAALVHSAISQNKGAKAACIRKWCKTLEKPSRRPETDRKRRCDSNIFYRGEELYGNYWEFKEYVVKTFYPKFLNGVTPKD